MNSSSFIKYLVLSIISALGIHFIINFFLPIAKYNDILAYAIVFFSSICIFIYWLSVKGTKTKQNNFFLYIVIINVFIKLVAAFVFILLYAKIKEPSDKFFLVPFLMTYLIFTLFETIVLSQQARKSI